jgi:hypothetical protein
MVHEDSGIKHPICFATGVVLVCIGVVCNVWTLTKLFPVGEVICETLIRKFYVRTAGTALMVTGIALIAVLKMLVELGRRKCLFCLI